MSTSSSKSPKRPIKRASRVKSPKAIKLPSITAFKALPLRQRTLVFARWVRSQPPLSIYQPSDMHGCALCEFGKALGLSMHMADAANILDPNECTPLQVPNEPNGVIFRPCQLYGDPSTYAALASRLSTYLKTPESRA